MAANTIFYNARLVSLISFLLGTGIFIFYYFTDATSVIFFGIGFIIIAGFTNLVYLILVVTQIKKTKEKRRSYFLTCLIIFLNFPIMILYCWFTLSLMNIMRITLVNETASIINDIKILGCEEKHINKLEPNESKLVWVTISGDCLINIEFNKNGKLEGENILGYITSNAGYRMTHRITEKNIRLNK